MRMMHMVSMTVVVAVVAVAAVSGFPAVPDTPYVQLFTTPTAYTSAPNKAAWPVVGIPVSAPATSLARLSAFPSSLLIGSDAALFILDTAAAKPAVKPLTVASGLAAPVPGSRVGAAASWIAFVAPTGGWYCPESAFFAETAAGCVVFSGSYTNVTKPLAMGGNGMMWGDAHGLYMLAASPGAAPVKVAQDELPPHAPELTQVRSLAYDGASGTVAVGLHRALLRLTASGEWSWTWRHGFISAAPAALAFAPDSALWIGAKDALCTLLPNGQVLRYDGVARVAALAGLPHANITSATMTADGTRLVLGTLNGVVTRELATGAWGYYAGPRWMAGAVVADVATAAAGVVGVATDVGITLFEFTPYTLREKAELYMATLVRHDRYGLVGDCGLSKFGQLDSWYPMPNDNNGLWTSLVSAGLAFKYAATQSEADRAAAWHYFEGLELLMNVTGVAGYPARSVWPYGEDAGSGLWWNSTNPAYAKTLQWKGDTSSDEITGHVFGALVAYKTGVGATADEKARIAAHVTAIADGLLEHDFELWGNYGNRTTWGVWKPSYLNGKYSWRDERGVNSAQVLGFLAAAYEVSSDAKYLKAIDTLVSDHGYGANLVNIKITWRGDGNAEGKDGGAGSVGDINFSDDELSFLPIATLLLSPAAASPLTDQLLAGLETLFARVEPEKSSLWNLIYALAHGGADAATNAPLVADAVATLRQWPTSLVAWPIDNTVRIDTMVMPDLTRGSGIQALNLIPYDEQAFFRWNGNPFAIQDGGSGMSESDPGAWLLPYWMGVWMGVIGA